MLANPEPYTYQSGFAVKWLLEEQTRGDAAVSFEQGRALGQRPAHPPHTSRRLMETRARVRPIMTTTAVQDTVL